MRPFFKNDDFNFLTEIALGSVYWQAADVGEVLPTVDRIHDGKARSWVDEWTATAGRLTPLAGGGGGGGPGAVGGGPVPSRIAVLLAGDVLGRRGRRAGSVRVAVGEAPGRLGPVRGPGRLRRDGGRADRDPVRGDDAARLLLPVGPGRDAAADADLQQRQRRLGGGRVDRRGRP